MKVSNSEIRWKQYNFKTEKCQTYIFNERNPPVAQSLGRSVDAVWSAGSEVFRRRSVPPFIDRVWNLMTHLETNHGNGTRRVPEQHGSSGGYQSRGQDTVQNHDSQLLWRLLLLVHYWLSTSVNRCKVLNGMQLHKDNNSILFNVKTDISYILQYLVQLMFIRAKCKSM